MSIESFPQDQPQDSFQEQAFSVSESVPKKESVPSESLGDAQDFMEAKDAVFTLVESDFSDEIVIPLIHKLLNEQKNNRYFPHLIHELDPATYSLMTKMLKEQARSQLARAIDSFQVEIITEP